MSYLINPYRFGSGVNPLLPNVISYYPLDTNSNDFVGSNNGVDSTISYVTGYVDDCANFALGGTISNITLPHASNLSFGNGTTDTPFSFSFWVNFGIVADCFLFDKRVTTSGTGFNGREYFIRYTGSAILFRLFDQSTGGYIQASASTSMSTSTWYYLTVTYDGSSSNTGLSIYKDAILLTSINSTSGTYTAMENGGGDITIGKYFFNTSFSLAGNLDEISIFDKELTLSEIEFIKDRNDAGNPLF